MTTASAPGPSPTPRYGGLDALRAGAMLLGLVYHATYAYVPGVGPYYPVVDPSSAPFFASLAAALHAFRMHVFFALAGFFSHLLVEKRGPAGFLADRAKRLLVPMAVALPITWAADAATRSLSQAQGLMDGTYWAGTAVRWMPVHLWFLEYLFLFCAVTAALHRRALPGARGWVRWAVERPETLLLLAFPTGVGLALGGGPMPDRSFVPQLGTVLTMGLFYAFGYALYSARASVGALARRGPFFAAAGLALAGWLYTRPLQWTPLGLGLGGAVAWLVTLGGLGVALEARGAGPRPVVRELVDASYWVYLVHYPLVQLFQVLAARLPGGAAVHFVGVVVATFAVAWGTYQGLVRHTPVQDYLGVKRPSRGEVEACVKTS